MKKLCVALISTLDIHQPALRVLNEIYGRDGYEV